MKHIITGVAGFIGSSIAQELLRRGETVVGIDCLTDYYSVRQKEANLDALTSDPNFTFLKEDLTTMALAALLDPGDVVFHQAAQAGVRASWGDEFTVYLQENIAATQRLLEAAKDANLRRLVYASSSSVYGDCELPMHEDRRLQPVSPYGVTKLAAEHLCYLYWKNFGVPSIMLRYFTVYGPRQRPDMAFHKFIRAALSGSTISIYGDGEQTRDFTFISDAVEANLLAAAATDACNGEVFNIGGGNRITVNGVLAILEALAPRPLAIEYVGEVKGDVRHTLADASKAKRRLGFDPVVDIETGLKKEFEWLETYLATEE